MHQNTATRPYFPILNPPERLGLVFNPVSLRNTQDPDASQAFLSAFNDIGESVLVGDPEGLSSTFRKWHTGGLDLLAISGGDGTMQRVIDEILSIWGSHPLPRFLMIHGGTTGIVAKETGCIDPMEAVSILTRARQSGHPLPEDSLLTLKVGERYTLSIGLGLFRQLSADYTTIANQAFLSQLMLGARFTGSFLTRGPYAKRALASCPYRMRIDDTEYPEDYFVGLYASSLNSISLFKPFEGMNCPAGGFKVIGIQSMNRRTAMRSIRPMLKGESHGYPKEFLLCSAHRLELESTSGLIEYMADGEFYSERNLFSVQLGPELKVIRLDQMT